MHCTIITEILQTLAGRRTYFSSQDAETSSQDAYAEDDLMTPLLPVTSSTSFLVPAIGSTRSMIFPSSSTSASTMGSL